MCSIFLLLAHADRVRPARIDEVRDANKSLTWDMRVDLKEFNANPKFFERLHAYLISSDLGLSTCFMEINNKSVELQDGKITVGLILQSKTQIMLKKFISVEPKQNNFNRKELEECLKKNLLRKKINEGERWIEEKKSITTTITFSYAMPN